MESLACRCALRLASMEPVCGGCGGLLHCQRAGPGGIIVAEQVSLSGSRNRESGLAEFTLAPVNVTWHGSPKCAIQTIQTPFPRLPVKPIKRSRLVSPSAIGKEFTGALV